MEHIMLENYGEVLKKIKTNRIHINKIKHNLNKDLWTIKIKGRKKYITPNQVIKNSYLSPYDFCNIINIQQSN